MCTLIDDFCYGGDLQAIGELAELWPGEALEWCLRYVPAIVFDTDGRGHNCLFQALLLALPAAGVALPPDVMAAPWEDRAAAFRRHTRTLTEARTVACVPGSDECRRLRAQLQALAGGGGTEEASAALVAEACGVHINVVAFSPAAGQRLPCLCVTQWHGGRPGEALPQVWLLHADDHEGHFRALVPKCDLDAISFGAADTRSVTGLVMHPSLPPARVSVDSAASSSRSLGTTAEDLSSLTTSSRSIKPEILATCHKRPERAPAEVVWEGPQVDNDVRMSCFSYVLRFPSPFGRRR